MGCLISEGIYNAFPMAGKIIFALLHKKPSKRKDPSVRLQEIAGKANRTQSSRVVVYVVPKNLEIFFKFIIIDELRRPQYMYIYATLVEFV